MAKIYQLVAGIIIFGLVVSVAGIAQARRSNEDYKITICHRTSSESNPYVEITVDNHGQLNGHSHHRGDIIPAPQNGCPKPTPASTPTPTPTPTLTAIPGAGGGTGVKVTPKVLGTSAPVATRLPQTGVDSSIYYFIFMGALVSTFLMKKYGWRRLASLKTR